MLTLDEEQERAIAAQNAVLQALLKLGKKEKQAIHAQYAAIRKMKAMSYLTVAAKKATAIKAVVDDQFLQSKKKAPLLYVTYFFNSDREVIDCDFTEIE